MKIPAVHTLRLENAELAPSETISVDIRPETYIDDIGLFEDKKEYVKWVYRLEHKIRESPEYKDLIEFLKKKHGMDTCGVHPNLHTWNGFRIELHHTPFFLSDLVHIVTNKRLETGQDLRMDRIAREIMELHYCEVVGLYPLCQLCHYQIHDTESDPLFIPIANTFGNPYEFVDIYGKYMTPAVRTKWDTLKILEDGYTIINNNLPIELQKKYIYVKNLADEEGDAISTKKLVDFIVELNESDE